MNATQYKHLLARKDLADFLPYQDYTGHGMYILSDGGLGFAVECTPLPVVDDKVYKGLLSTLACIPGGAAVQFILFSSPDSTPIIDRWLQLKTRRDGLCGEVVENYKSFLERAAWSKISKHFTAPLRTFRLVITVKIGGKEKEHTLFDQFLRAIFGKKHANGHSPLSDETRYKEACDLKDKFTGALKGAFLNPAPLEPNGLISFIYPLLNGRHDMRHKPKWDGARISDICIANDTEVVRDREYVSVDDICVKSLNVKEYPEAWSLGQVLDYTGNIFTDQNHDHPFLIVLNAIKLTDNEMRRIDSNASMVLSQKYPYALFPRLKFKHMDLQPAKERIEKGGRCYRVNLSLMIFAKDPNHLNTAAGSFTSYFRGLGFRLEEDLYIHLPVLLSNLPFGYDATTAGFLNRGRVVFEENVATLVPISADWSGTKPQVLLTSPRGGLMGWDLFSSPRGGFNAYVVGTTRSGKSVLLQLTSAKYLLANYRCWIVDIGRSYERLAHIFDGEFFEQRLDRAKSMNPFTTILDAAMLNEYLKFLCDFYFLMGSPKERVLNEQLEKLISSHLADAIQESFQKYAQESDIDSTCEMLEKVSHDNRVRDFITTLKPYRSKGQYGAFFNRESKIRFTSPLVVMENDTLENIPELRDPALMLMTFHISREIYRVESHKYAGDIVIIDEAHKFLGTPRIDLFIEQAYRRFGKHGAAIMLGTQGYEDFQGTDGLSRAGRVVVQNSAWQLFTLQQATSRQALKKSNQFSFTPYEESLMDSVKLVRGEFSEVLICAEGIRTKGRVVLDSFLKAMFFTDDEVRHKIKQLVAAGRTFTEAVREIEEALK